MAGEVPSPWASDYHPTVTVTVIIVEVMFMSQKEFNKSNQINSVDVTDTRFLYAATALK